MHLSGHSRDSDAAGEAALHARGSRRTGGRAGDAEGLDSGSDGDDAAMGEADGLEGTSDDGELVCSGEEFARLAAAAAAARPRRRRLRDDGGHVVDGAPRACPACGLLLPGDRQLCAACTPRALGWAEPPAHLAQAMDALCNAPSLTTLERVLTDVDVSDNGSCWVYAALVTHGLAAHALHFGAPACSDGVATRGMEPSLADRRGDAYLREAVAAWVADNGGVRRFDGVRSEESLAIAEARLARIRKRIPTRAGAAGEWGGDTEMLAVASLLGCNVFTYRAARGDVVGALFSPLRGEWTTVTTGAMLRVAMMDGIPLIVLSNHHGSHWHARVPCTSDRRVLVKVLTPERHGFGLDAARTAAVGARLRGAGWT